MAAGALTGGQFMKRILTAVAACALVVAAGCASDKSTVRTKQGAVGGAAVGAITGAIIGNQSGGRAEQGALIGAAAGALGGGVLGSSADEKANRQQQQQGQ